MLNLQANTVGSEWGTPQLSLCSLYLGRSLWLYSHPQAWSGWDIPTLDK